MASLALPAVGLLFLTGFLLLVSRDWRLSIGLLAVQYGGVFVLVSLNWPLEMAVVKLVAGWMAGAVLGMALVGVPEAALNQDKRLGSHFDMLKASAQGRPELESFLFRFLIAILVGLIVVSLTPNVLQWVPGMAMAQVLGGFILIGMGLSHLGLVAQPLRVVLGLLTVLAGFEVMYAAVEASTLVSGLLAGVNLGLALVGAYLVSSPWLEEGE